MDFTSQFHFTPGQPYQPFMSIPPLTPSNSHSALDDFHTNTSPPVGFVGSHAVETIPNQPEQFQGFNYSHAFPDPSASQLQNHHGLSSPPTPPDRTQLTTLPLPLLLPAAAHGIAQDRIHIQHEAPAIVGQAQGHHHSAGLEADVGSEDPTQLRGGSDDDESLTPAQSRRKAQNRAA
ncbi:hypothetical protein E4U54_006182 [Claviceps lovelessii]|nr:hypothetical protein E4U54_006182 [Claviceps lovelessii]